MGKTKAAGSNEREYEECRRRRVEENKKRMEELNLSKLAKSLSSSSLKSHLKKGRTPLKRPEPSSAPVRRSSRVANKPAPNYKEVTEIEGLGRVRRSRSMLNSVRASDEVRLYAIERAGRLQSTLDAEFPSFVKPMLQSHVAGGFWLSLPYDFCHKHLPYRDETVTLVDEDGEEFDTKYLIKKNGLSGGWRGFAIAHELVDGDALVFQLIKPTVFKVHIIRAYESEDHDKDTKEADVTRLDRSAKRIRASKK